MWKCVGVRGSDDAGECGVGMRVWDNVTVGVKISKRARMKTRLAVRMSVTSVSFTHTVSLKSCMCKRHNRCADQCCMH